MVYLNLKKMKTFIIKNLKVILFLLSIVITILVGSLIGIVLVYQKGFPHQIKNLEDLKPKVMTTVYDDQNNLIKEFAIEKRTIVKSTDIPQVLKNALIAGEDNEYYSHWGISFKGLARAIMGILLKKNLGGGSTITMQLARNLFLYDRRSERSFSRKLNEIFLAIQIEKKYSKEQILTFYCNKISFGGSAYGVEAAAQRYFGKSVRDINLAEAALLSTVPPSPNGKYHVFRQPKNCRDRRNAILKRMLELEYITEAQHKEAIKVELPKKPGDFYKESIGDYFIEESRKYIEEKYGETLLYQGGMRVYTTLNSEMQRWAEAALREGLRKVDKRRGWRGVDKTLNLVTRKLDPEKHQLESWAKLQLKEDKIVKGVVRKVDDKSATIIVKNFRGRLAAKDAKWTKKSLSKVLKMGDVALFKVLEVSGPLKDYLEAKKPDPKIDLTAKKYELNLGLEQAPEALGAILVVENKTGAIKAMVGGYSFAKSKWNNATQSKRQPGSTFKPIIYTAAIENGYNPSRIIVDEYFSDFDFFTEELWEPQNYPIGFKGPITLRRALELSRNIISAKLVKDLTPNKIVNYGRRFGIESELKPYMTISLGAFEVTLLEMVATYTVFPNSGIRVSPFFIKSIRDQNNIIEENMPERKQVLERETAYVMTYLMQGVIQSGTGQKAKHLPAPIGGKTGTTDEFTNAWFIGYSPSITVGVWIGLDEAKDSLGRGETGGKAACPIFVEFMEKYLEKHPEPQQFRKPPGVIMVKIDKYTGKLWTEDCLHPFWEAFLPGTEPTEYCTEEDHDMIEDYYGKWEDEDDEG
jgi:penicillin-binding protein 1A